MSSPGGAEGLAEFLEGDVAAQAGEPRMRRGGMPLRFKRRPRGGGRDDTAVGCRRRGSRRGGAALAVGRVAGREAKVRGGSLLGDDDIVSEDKQASVEKLAHIEPAARPRPTTGPRGQLHDARAEGQRVVTGDEARIAAAQNPMQIAWSGAPDAGQRRGRGSEAAIVVDDEGGQEGVRGLQGVHTAQAQLADQAILQGAPEAFNAPFSLRRMGSDEGDAEVGKHAAEMRRRLRARELLVEGPVAVVADEDIEAIAIKRQGQAVGAAEVLEQGCIAVEILVRPEPQSHDLRAGIVDGAQERQGGPTVFEPSERTAVELDEAPDRVRPRPATAMGRGAPRPLSQQAKRQPDTTDRGATNGQSVHLAQLLREVHVIDRS